MREQCEGCSLDINPFIKGPSEKELAVQPAFKSYTWFQFDILTPYSYITLFHLCLSLPIFSYINSGFNLGGSQMHSCKVILSVKMSTHFEFILLVAN